MWRIEGIETRSCIIEYPDEYIPTRYPSFSLHVGEVELTENVRLLDTTEPSVQLYLCHC